MARPARYSKRLRRGSGFRSDGFSDKGFGATNVRTTYDYGENTVVEVRENAPDFVDANSQSAQRTKNYRDAYREGRKAGYKEGYKDGSSGRSHHKK